MENIVFIEQDIKVRDISHFSQYVLLESKLITLFGESHGLELPCEPPETTVSQYTLNTVDGNKKARVLMEYHPTIDPNDLISIIIKDTYNLLKLNGKQDVIIPFDYRLFYIGEYQRDLYDTHLQGYTEDDIKLKLIKPIFDKWEEGFSLNLDDYTPDAFNYLSHVYLLDLHNTFMHVDTLLGISYETNYELVLDALKRAWMKVADFYILREILKISTVNEYIIIMGYEHYNNLLSVFNSSVFERINQSQETSDNNCINLFNTAIIEF